MPMGFRIPEDSEDEDPTPYLMKEKAIRTTVTSEEIAKQIMEWNLPA